VWTFCSETKIEYRANVGGRGLIQSRNSRLPGPRLGDLRMSYWSYLVVGNGTTGMFRVQNHPERKAVSW
jgi:hypothetical protein